MKHHRKTSKSTTINGGIMRSTTEHGTRPQARRTAVTRPIAAVATRMGGRVQPVLGIVAGGYQARSSSTRPVSNR
jgi:hypothetical protein